MTRTIKFRGKRLDDPQQWEYGYYRQDETDAWMHTLDGRVLRIIPDTLGQFTGLHDKDGREIYEGDILRICKRDGVIKEEEVRWHRDGFILNDDALGFEALGWICLRKLEYQPQVVGNIHDNPDLQKGGQP